MPFINEDVDRNKTGIYKIVNKINNKVYIGQTTERFERRYWHHWWLLKNNQHSNPYLQEDWNEYGEYNFDFIVEVAVENPDKELVDVLEKKYIELYRKNNLCYNILVGGSDSRKGVPMSEHAKKMVGEKNKIHMTGKKCSPETKAKMSATRTGQSYTYQKKTNVLNEDIAYQIKTMLTQGINPVDVAKSLNVKYKSVNNILSSNSWKHVYVDGWDEFQKARPMRTKITEEERNNILFDFFDKHLSKPEIAEKYNRKITTIRNIIHHHLITV